MSKIVITGASNGIGYQLAEQLTEAGHKVVNIDVVNNDNPNVEFIRGDVSDFKSFKAATDCIPGIDILINNAAVNFIDWIEKTPDEEWERVVGINAKGIFNVTKVFLDRLLASKGTILNMVSAAAHTPMTHSIAYNASKGAAHIMTLQMARELGPKGITVFGIAPNRTSGTVIDDYVTKKVCELRGWSKDEADEYQASVLPAGEPTDPATLAEFMTFILETKKRHMYMAGTILPYGR